MLLVVYLNLCYSKRVLSLDKLVEGISPLANFVFSGPRERLTSIASISEMGHEPSFGANDAALDSRPVSSGNDGLEFAGFRELASLEQLHKLDARLGRDVGHAANDTGSASNQCLQCEVNGPAHAHEAGSRI